MNPKESKSSESLLALSKKTFSRGHDEPSYPLYTNAIEFASMGVDVFMDVGTVAPEAVQAALQRQQQNPGVQLLDFNVVYRFGMSLQTALQMHQRLTEIINRSRENMEGAIKESLLKQEQPR